MGLDLRRVGERRNIFCGVFVHDVEAVGEHQANIAERGSPGAGMFFVEAQVAGFNIEGEHGEVRAFGFAQVAFGVAAVFGGGLVVAACGG